VLLRHLTLGLVAALVVVPASSRAEEDVRNVLWTTRAETPAQAQMAQESLYLTLFNTGRLPVKTAPMDGAKYVEDVLRREGAWVGGITAQVAALLCALNQDHASRS
jgi:hypothetical protein